MKLRVYFLITFLTFANSAWSEAKTSLFLTSNIYSRTVRSRVLSAQQAGTLLEADFTHHLLPNLQTKIQGGARLEGGSSRALFNDEFAPRQTPVLKEASVSWTPVDPCNLRAGAINQNFLDSPLLSYEQSFPALYENCQMPIGNFKLGVELEQSYASDTQNTQPTGRSLQSDSSFFIERLSLAYEASDDVKGKLHVSHYMFSGLSPLVAYQSQFMGNTSSGLDEKNADFSFAYQGYEYGFTGQGKLLDNKVEAKYTGLRNSGAPGGANTGHDVHLKVTREFKDFSLAPELRYFKIESDAAPAFFNDRTIGHANMQGYGAQVSALMPKIRTEVLLNYTMAKPLRVTLNQPGVQNYFFAVLRINYEIL